jgi:hypothetical protein
MFFKATYVAGSRPFRVNQTWPCTLGVFFGSFYKFCFISCVECSSNFNTSKILSKIIV